MLTVNKLTGRLTPGPGIFTAVVGDEIVLWSEVTGTYYSLSAVGARVWRLSEEKWSVAAIEQTLLDEFDGAADAIRADLQVLLQECAENGLLVAESDLDALTDGATEPAPQLVEKRQYERPALRTWGTTEELTADAGAENPDGFLTNSGGV